MSRIDRYLRALETNRLDEYYEKQKGSNVKLRKFTKGQTREGGQGKYIGRGRNGKELS